jgi:hypothetical protein
MRPLAFLWEVARMAAADLAFRPLRTALTAASFVTSIAIATILLAAGGGVRTTVRDILRSLGEGHLMATARRTTGIGGQRRAGRPVRIRFEDVEGSHPALPSFAGVASFFDLRGGGASSRRYSIPWSPVRAVSRDYYDVRRFAVIEGRWFTDEEHEEEQWVAVLNEGLRQIIFPEGAAVGEWIEWRGRRMSVVGVVRDDAVFPYMLLVPYKTVSHMADARYISGLIARPRPGADWGQAVAELRRVVGGLGGFDPADENALEIEDNSEFLERVAAVSAALHALVITIAGVSLLLGGLGVANMMVIAVTERTREIGLRKALGATSRSIFVQVLCESLVLVLAGGAAGIALGAAGCAAVRALPVSAKFSAAVEFDAGAALLCILGLGLVGVLAAVIPARRAAGIPCAEALRWE